MEGAYSVETAGISDTLSVVIVRIPLPKPRFASVNWALIVSDNGSNGRYLVIFDNTNLGIQGSQEKLPPNCSDSL